MTAQFPALVLNADFRPISYFPLEIWSWQDAVRAVHLDKVSVVAEYDQVVRSPTVTMRLPSVIAMREYQRVDGAVPFTRFNVFLRDRFRCQYCGVKLLKGLTFDHVVPRRDGGQTTWENIVAACEPCNTEKGHRRDKSPATPPRQPTRGEIIKASMEFPPAYLHETWLDFLYWDAELER